MRYSGEWAGSRSESPEGAAAGSPPQDRGASENTEDRHSLGCKRYFPAQSREQGLWGEGGEKPERELTSSLAGRSSRLTSSLEA